MSIRTSFNPMGTLGAVRDLPYVQPVKTGFGLNAHSNNPSFGFEVSNTGYAQIFYPWKAFMGPDAHTPEYCWLGGENAGQSAGGTGSAVFTFAKQLKIESLLVRKPAWILTKMTLYGLHDSAETWLGSVLLKWNNIDYELVVNNPSYYSAYKIINEQQGEGFPSLQDIRLNAVYKA